VTIIEQIAAAQTSIEAKVLRLNKPDWALCFFFIDSYGRGGGVGRGLGVRAGLGVVEGLVVAVAVAVAVMVDVEVAVAVAVADAIGVTVAVGVAVGVGVGVGCTSNDPTSMRPLNTRTNPGPR
jgi:hypothetical protein